MPTSAAYAALVEAASHVRPVIALSLGSGLGPALAGLQRQHSVAFADIAGLSVPSVHGHAGRLSLGLWAGQAVLVFEGRLHYYEGCSWEQVVLPVRLAHALGVRNLLLTNAAGGIEPTLEPGHLLAITDHLEWTRPYCWRAPGPGALGPPRHSFYSPRLLQRLSAAGTAAGFSLRQGLYAAVTGPCYETPAEVRALRFWGAAAVGMSTTREIQTGHELGLECAAVSLITNYAAGRSGAPLQHEEVLTTAAAQSQRLARLLECFLPRL